MRIGLVGCVKQKLAFAAPARGLYVSPLFRGRRAWVERTCDYWFILSALYGVIDPGEVIEPYDQTLKNAGRLERRGWSSGVLDSLKARVGPVAGLIFEIHAGADYFSWGLKDGLEAAGASVEIPTFGLPVGKQLAFYANAQ